MSKKTFIKRLVIAGVLVVFVITLGANVFVALNARGKTFNEIDDVPKRKVALVLGTSKYVSDGRENLYYTYRMDAAEALYKGAVVESILVSGDNATLSYDEPTQMQKDLLARGISEDDIYLDYAGFRTLDSVIRAKEVFGQDDIIIVSQEFHNNRALLIAQFNDIDALGYNAQSPFPIGISRAGIREVFARTKLMIDLLVNKQPKFLGEPVEIQ